MFGQYKRLRDEFTGTLTGKGRDWGGSPLRPEATGYGVCYFAQEMLAARGDSFEGKTVAVSGSGNVAQYACQKATALGAKVVTLSDSSGYIFDPDGITPEKLDYVMELKNIFRGRIREYADRYPSAVYHPGERPWGEKCDIAMPCATQNELDGEDARKLVGNGCRCVAEGANMPSTPEAIRLFQQHRLLYAPGKAANAGGVATSGLEMCQNSMRLAWTPEEVNARLHAIMRNIHAVCVQYGTEPDGYINYVVGANISAEGGERHARPGLRLTHAATGSPRKRSPKRNPPLPQSNCDRGEPFFQKSADPASAPRRKRRARPKRTSRVRERASPVSPRRTRRRNRPAPAARYDSRGRAAPRPAPPLRAGRSSAAGACAPRLRRSSPPAAPRQPPCLSGAG